MGIYRYRCRICGAEFEGTAIEFCNECGSDKLDVKELSSNQFGDEYRIPGSK